MNIRLRPSPRRIATMMTGAAVASALLAPAAVADTAPPHFTDGFGLTVVGQPAWVSAWNQRITEHATRGVPLITVWPNGAGRSWYTNWADPGALGPQNWETFHLDQIIPLIDANLRTIPTRAGRAVAGHSMGGFGAFHYAEDRPDLFSLDNLAVRAAVVETELDPSAGTPTVPADAIFGSPVWPADGRWIAQSPAEHVDYGDGSGGHRAVPANTPRNPASRPTWTTSSR